MEPLQSLDEDIKALGSLQGDEFGKMLTQLLNKAEIQAKKQARRALFYLILFSLGLQAIGFAAGRYLHF